MEKIYNFVKKEYTNKIVINFIFLIFIFKVYPPKDLIFNAFKVTSWDNLKIVVIGQDPYPNIGEAMGLSFSVPKNIKTPKSLINIYKCLNKDEKIKNFKIPNHGDLTKWAEQGVFLLNATLTVVHKEANSHQKTSGWSNFTDYVIKTISEKKKNIVFLLWGKFAVDKKKFIDLKK